MHLHYHPEIELTLILQGRGMRLVGDGIAPFDPGDLCLLGGNLLHSWHTGNEPLPTQAIVLQVDPQLLTRVGELWPEFRRLSELPTQCARGVGFSGKQATDIATFLTQAAEAPEASAKRLTFALLALHAACDATDVSYLATTGAIPPQAAGAMARFGRIIDTLHKYMPQAPDQAALADQARMSPAAFSRYFKRFVGRTYVDYVNAWRVGLACRQLLQSDRPITQIAFDCGFENLSNFNRRFRHYKRMTPREYRARYSHGA